MRPLPAGPPGVELNFEFVRVAGDLAYVSGRGPMDAIGVAELPFDIPVEIEAIVAL